MAEDLDDGEFWLPPQFLSDDDLLMDFKKTSKIEKDGGTNILGFEVQPDFSYGLNPFGANSDLSSPVEGSTETESDEEDYISSLTRKMANSTLLQDSVFNNENCEGWAVAGSPQSTLCGALDRYGCKQGSSRGSPNCPSRASSPPGLNRNEGAWDLLYKAAGEVARMRMIEEGASAVGLYPNRNRLGNGVLHPGKPSPISVPVKNPNPSVRFHTTQQPNNLSYHQLQVAQFQQLKQQQQMMKQRGASMWGPGNGGYEQYSQQMVQNGGRNGGLRPMNLSTSAWPTLQQSQLMQQQPGSGMRAVFLGNPGAKKECAGTGVFLPRRIGVTTEPRKKPVCSTVLLPDRVVQALNLNLESVDGQSQVQYRCNGSFSADYGDAALKYRNGSMTAQHRRNARTQPVMNPEVRLPPEWTY